MRRFFGFLAGALGSPYSDLARFVANGPHRQQEPGSRDQSEMSGVIDNAFDARERTRFEKLLRQLPPRPKVHR